MNDTRDILDTESLDIEALLSSLSLDLITDNIMNQIHGETTSVTDFLYTIQTKFKAILDDETIDDNDKFDIKDQMVEFCTNLIVEISNVFNIAVNLINDDYEGTMKILDTLYHFLILNRYANVEKFLINYISSNKTHLIENLNIVDKGKDVASLSNRKKNMDKDDICILSHISEIIDFIIYGNFIEPSEFISYVDDGELYISYLKSYYEDMTIVGNFSIVLLNTTLAEGYDGDEITKIRNNIRSAFYNN